MKGSRRTPRRSDPLDRQWARIAQSRTLVAVLLSGIALSMLPAHARELRAAPPDNGVWNAPGAGMALAMTPLVWQTWWFRSFLIVALIVLGAAVAWRLTTLQARRRRGEESLFRALVEAAPSAIVLVDAAGRIMRVNSQAETEFGYDRAELVGQSVDMLVPDRHRGQHEQLRMAYMDDPTTRPMGAGRELFGVRKDQTEIPVEVALTPIGIRGNMCVLVSIINVSERKRRERELAQQRNELAHMSRATMLGELSGALAHELNQPLTAILSNAQAARQFMAREPIDLDEVREILDDIVHQDKWAGEIIHRLRRLLSKVEMPREPLNLGTVVREVLHLMRSDLVEHHVEVQLDLSDLPPVLGDRVQLEQVLINLLMNARDAMCDVPVKERRLVVRGGAVDGTVWVGVSDAGPGMTKETLTRIFDPFFTTKTKGMGLGLTVCRNIAQSHGGELRAENNPGRGATFTLSIPGHDEAQQE